MMDATTVGKYFLSKNRELTDIQIQKLTYYAYAWYMIQYSGEKLFSENPQAWVHGPVFRSLYDAMKNSSFYADELKEVISVENKSFLDIIYKIYGKYSGNELEIITHSESPWKKARERVGLKDLPNNRSSEIIKDEDILEWGNQS